MLADQLDYVIGVDPHRDAHALAVVHVLSGAVVFETTVAADSGGYAEALKLVDVHAAGRRAFAVEGTGSFGAGLTRFLSVSGERVLEVGRLRRERRSGGKTDALDAHSIVIVKVVVPPCSSKTRVPTDGGPFNETWLVNTSRVGGTISR